MILKWSGAIAGLCSLVVPMLGETNRWLDVEQLRPGMPISVVKRVRQSCELMQVTESELTCRRDIALEERKLVFGRNEVREVRLEMPGRNKLVTGVIAGAVAGGLVGFLAGQQAHDPEARGYPRAYGIPIGAIIGGVVGHNIHTHGVVVYRR